MGAAQCAGVPRAVDGPGTVPERRRLLTQLEAAAELRLDTLALADPCRVIRRMAGRGQLRGVRVGRNLLIDPKSIDAYVAGGGK